MHLTLLKEELERKGCQVRFATGVKPKIIVYGVDIGCGEEELVKAIHKQNFEEKERTLEQVKTAFKRIFKTGPRNRPVAIKLGPGSTPGS